MRDISVEELGEWRLQGRTFVLLDVREPVELRLARIEGALHIPMRALAQRTEELDREVEIVVLCHSGSRSAHAARFLAANGFTRVYNLRGGIDAYARRIDPTIPTY